MNEPSFDGLLTDYALGEIDDPEVIALIEALLDKDEALRVALAEIRETTELVMLADPQLLTPRPGSRSMGRPWPVWAAGIAATAAVVLLALAWWRPPVSETDPILIGAADSRPVAEKSSPGSTAEAVRAMESTALPLPWTIAAVEKRSRRSTRRGAGVNWTALGDSLAENR